MFGVAAADCARSEGQSGQLQRRYRRRADELRQAPEGCGDTAKGTPVIHYLALKKVETGMIILLAILHGLNLVRAARSRAHLGAGVWSRSALLSRQPPSMLVQ